MRRRRRSTEQDPNGKERGDADHRSRCQPIGSFARHVPQLQGNYPLTAGRFSWRRIAEQTVALDESLV
jgi:hypothetical protein